MPSTNDRVRWGAMSVSSSTIGGFALVVRLGRNVVSFARLVAGLGAGVANDHQANAGVLIGQVCDRGAQRHSHVRIISPPRAESLIELFIGPRPQIPAPHTQRHQNRVTQPPSPKVYCRTAALPGSACPSGGVDRIRKQPPGVKFLLKIWTRPSRDR